MINEITMEDETPAEDAEVEEEEPTSEGEEETPETEDGDKETPNDTEGDSTEDDE